MPDDRALEDFLGRWLTVRMQDNAVAKEAFAIYGELPSLVDGELKQRFSRALTERIAGLKSLLQRIETDDDRPAAPSSNRAQWVRAAQRVVVQWDETQWSDAALALTNDKNPLLLAAVSQSLDESLERRQANREAIEALRALRARDERAFHSIPLPPAPRTPWNGTEYVFPRADRASLDKIDSGVADATRNAPPDSPVQNPAKALSDLIALAGAGWPVPRARLESALRQLVDLSPEGSKHLGTLRDALDFVSSDAGRSAPIATSGIHEPKARDDNLGRASEDLVRLARELLAETVPAAQAFARRLQDLAKFPGASTARGLHQELVGCLAFLDEGGSTSVANRWRRSTLDRLARIAQALGGGEVLDEQLLGQPLSRWTEFVDFVGYDNHAPVGESRRITQVERGGYRLIFSDGGRKALVRAHVRIAP
jgi:hypothetical protein